MLKLDDPILQSISRWLASHLTNRLRIKIGLLSFRSNIKKKDSIGFDWMVIRSHFAIYICCHKLAIILCIIWVDTFCLLVSVQASDVTNQNYWCCKLVWYNTSSPGWPRMIIIWYPGCNVSEKCELSVSLTWSRSRDNFNYLTLKMNCEFKDPLIIITDYYNAVFMKNPTGKREHCEICLIRDRLRCGREWITLWLVEVKNLGLFSVKDITTWPNAIDKIIFKWMQNYQIIKITHFSWPQIPFYSHIHLPFHAFCARC